MKKITSHQKSLNYVEYSHRHRSSRPEVFCRKGVLRKFTNFAGKPLCQSLFFNKVAGCNVIKKETLAQVFFCEFCEISKNTFFHRTPLVAASADRHVELHSNSYCRRLSFCKYLSHHDPYPSLSFALFLLFHPLKQLY